MHTPPHTHPHLWTRSGHLTGLALEQHRCADLSGAERATVSEHLSGCAACNAALSALTPTEPLPALPWLQAPAALAPAALTPANDDAAATTQSLPHTPKRARWYGLGGLIAAAAAILFVVWLNLPHQQAVAPNNSETSPAPPTQDPEDIRIKGASFSLEVLAHDSQNGIRPVNSGDTVFPGERLGFKVLARRSGYLMIIGLDDQGQDYLCYPQHNNSQAAPLGPTHQPLGLDEAVRLDEVLGHERIIALFCESPFALSDIRPNLSLPTQNPLRSGCIQSEIDLVKRPTPKP